MDSDSDIYLLKAITAGMAANKPIAVATKASDIPGVLDEAIAIKAKTFWMQLGISDDVSAERGVAAGLNVVQDKCIKIEHARFAGGPNLAGFNTGVISSKRNKSI